MADRKRRGSQDQPAGDNSQSIFDLFEPAPEKDSDSFGKIPVIRGEQEIDLSDGATHAEVKAAADAEAAGLQHWTAPPTGQIPAVLGSDEKAGLWGNVEGPSWQGGDTSWSGPDLSDVFAETESIDNSSGSVNEPEEDGAYRTAKESTRRVSPPPAPTPEGRPTARTSTPKPAGARDASRPAPQPRPVENPPNGRADLSQSRPTPTPPQPIKRRTGPVPRSRVTQRPGTDATTNELWSDNGVKGSPPPRQPSPQGRQSTPPPRQPSPQARQPMPAPEKPSPSPRQPTPDPARSSGRPEQPRPERDSVFDDRTQRPNPNDERPPSGSVPVDPDHQVHQQQNPRPDQHASGLGSQDSGRDLPKAIAVGVGLAVLVIGALILGPQAMLALVSVVALLAVLELFNAMRLAGLRPATLLGAVGTVAVPAAAFYRGDAAFPLIVGLAVVFSALWYLVGADFERPVLNMSLTLKGILWIGGLAGFAGLMLRESGGIELLAATVLITVASDTVAYIGGKSFGSKPLHHVSPNKTWEGTLSGFFAAVFVGLALGLTEVGSIWDESILAALCLGVVVGVLAPIGDLAESLVKRDLGVKDMGTLLPGHGGVLDRVDGLLFALPGAYYLALVFSLFS